MGGKVYDALIRNDEDGNMFMEFQVDRQDEEMLRRKLEPKYMGASIVFSHKL